MSGSKDSMLDHQEAVQQAAEYLVKIGHLEACEAHGVIFGGGVWTLEDDFYKKVMFDRGRGTDGPVPWAATMETRAYTDLLVEAYQGHVGEGCFSCNKNMAD